MRGTLEEHMEKLSKFRLTGKNVKIENVNQWVNDVVGVVAFENDKGIFVDDTAFKESVFMPWSSIAVLKLLDD
jgi:hypothetical protein